MTALNPSWQDIKQVISGWSDKQLVGLVQDLYRLTPENAAFLNARLLKHSAPKQALAPYKKRIRAAISPKDPWRQDVRLSEGRKAISEFKKANGNAHDTLTLMTYYVQCGNDFTLEFGDIDARFYDSMCSMVGQIKDCLLKEQDPEMLAEFFPLLEREFARIDQRIGWGYPDEFRGNLDELKSAHPHLASPS